MKLRRKAQSIMEFLALISFILAVFFIFQKYISRGFVGRMKATGDTWGYGRQYDPDITSNCRTSLSSLDRWIDTDCFEANDCHTACLGFESDDATCSACEDLCDTDICNNAQLPPAI